MGKDVCSSLLREISLRSYATELCDDDLPAAKLAYTLHAMHEQEALFPACPPSEACENTIVCQFIAEFACVIVKVFQGAFGLLSCLMVTPLTIHR